MSKPRLIFNLPRAAAWRSMYDWDMGNPGIEAVTHLRQAFEAMARCAACGHEVGLYPSLSSIPSQPLEEPQYPPANTPSDYRTPEWPAGKGRGP